MRPSTIWYTLKQGVKNIKRNMMFSIASVLTMSACILLFGVFYSIVNNVNNIAHKVEEEVPITVFFDEGTTAGEVLQLPGISEGHFQTGSDRSVYPDFGSRKRGQSV